MKVLIAEDDFNIRMGLVDLLDEEGYQCIQAANGEEAYTLFVTEQPQLILLDIMMPLLDGYSVCRKIRELNSQVPVVFITAKSEEIDQVIGLELGADDYIKKPFGTQEVIARINAVLRRCNRTSGNKPRPNDAFKMGDLTVFPQQLRAERGSSLIELSLRDVKILQLLCRETGKVVDRDLLFNECWGRDYLPSSRTLDQHISKLRKLIERDPRHPKIIKTAHGVGYRYDNGQ